MVPVTDLAAEQRVGIHVPLRAAPQQPKQANSPAKRAHEWCASCGNTRERSWRGGNAFRGKTNVPGVPRCRCPFGASLPGFGHCLTTAGLRTSVAPPSRWPLTGTDGDRCALARLSRTKRLPRLRLRLAARAAHRGGQMCTFQRALVLARGEATWSRARLACWRLTLHMAQISRTRVSTA